MKAVGGSSIAAVAGYVSNVLALNPNRWRAGKHKQSARRDRRKRHLQVQAVVHSYLNGAVRFVIVGKIFPRQIGATSIYTVITAVEELIRQQVNTMIDTPASARVKIVESRTASISRLISLLTGCMPR
jgi:hypothetical protein